MGKKRKVSGRPYGHNEHKEFKIADSKVKVNTYEDVADSEDEFHIQRDKVLLEDNREERRRRKWQAEDQLLEPSDEEVLAYSSNASDDDDQDQSEEDDEFDEETQAPPPKRLRRSSNSEDSVESEVDEDAGGWGSSKRDYYNADAIETEADALEEEAEAKRLQQKRLQSMTEADFGFDENEWLEAGKKDAEAANEEEGGVITEVLPPLQISGDMGAEERLKILKTRYPEFEPLAAEFLKLQPMHEDLRLAANAAKVVQQHGRMPNLGSEPIVKALVADIKYQALTAYLGTLSMYFALLTSTSRESQGTAVAMSASSLRDHDIMDSLLRCRETWEKVKDIRIPEPSEQISNRATPSLKSKIMADAQVANGVHVKPIVKSKPMKPLKKSKAQRAAEVAQAEAEARRAERIRKTEEELAELDVLTTTKPRRPTSKAIVTNQMPENGEDSDFGEETHLTPHDAAEKARRKKSLRFYTSQIAQKSNKRGAAGRDAGGDTDLPYRERLKDRQARLNDEAEKRGKRNRDVIGDDNEIGGESDEEDRRQAKELRNEIEDGSEDDYYDMIASRTNKRKTDKKDFAAAQAEALKQGSRILTTEAEIGPDGKRAIGYVIEKNKGLAPKRKKDVRNPRVKKRKKYEDKKKKLGSVRQVYKGGEGRGGYGGEKTGIKKGLIKSIKL
ncbi:MAG: hypothetical protein M1812_007826 [Candelaria pacifica]|nr:MAG: hypothetical protein M1812_007826 [Candelaria pacifica]